MKNNLPDAKLAWKQLEEDLVPRLGLILADRVVCAYFLRHSRLEGKRQLGFSISSVAGSLGLSDATVRKAVRRLARKGALRLVERTRGWVASGAYRC